MPVYTFFNQSLTATITADASTYTMGIEFTSSQTGTLTGIWWYSAAGAVNLPGTIALYSMTSAGATTGTLVVSQASISWSGAAASGWVKAQFTSAPTITAGTYYKACIGDYLNNGNFYASIGHYWDTGAGSGGITSGPLSAPNNATAGSGQDSFNTTNSLAFPATSFNATNYLVDLELTVAPSAQFLAPMRLT